jgi:pimeloyl-ACP methyl ester carboxylesterase
MVFKGLIDMKNENLRYVFAAGLILLTILLAHFSGNIINFARFALLGKNEILLTLSKANLQVNHVTADPSNRLVLKIEARDREGTPAAMVPVRLTVNGSQGKVYPAAAWTNALGECIVSYIPPDASGSMFINGPVPVSVKAEIPYSSQYSTVSFKLLPAPVVFIHGYLANGSMFDNLKEYLAGKGFDCTAFNYESQKGVAYGAKQLFSFLNELKLKYLSKGIQAGKSDIIAHSMGGLVARYYTCSEDYVRSGDVRKIIFMSVPQKGSPFASLGLNYYNDAGIKDLVPDSQLISDILPGMTNGGLNSFIQAGSILGQYDEVVSPDSASLKEWGIETEVFNVGESNFSMDMLLNGKITEASNHKAILSNKKVFDKIVQMLNGRLPYPAVRKPEKR